MTQYRRDIDGLRAVAVSIVILYHAQLRQFSGGFVGVDVFLVISGFLITGLIVEQNGAGGFRLANFYRNRAWRILPALAAVTGATLLAATCILSPYLLVPLAKSALAALLFVPNIYFALHQNYFDLTVPESPLLHTWSLGLEEQFYLLFPPLLMVVARYGRRRTRALLCVTLVASFALSVWLIGSHPTATFYFLPTRAWEFLIGGAAYLWKDGAYRSGWRSEWLGGLGLACIALAATTLTPGLRYPGIIALLPCLGTCALLVANTNCDTWVARVLSWSGCVWLGRLSYSLYLCHWPIFALARQLRGPALGPGELIACFILTLATAMLCGRFVEQRFRLRLPAASMARPIRPLVAVTITELCAISVFVLCGGFASRMPAAALRYGQTELPDDVYENRCHHGPPEVVAGVCTLVQRAAARDVVLIWGDSHANVLASVSGLLGEAHDMTVLQATYSGCPPLLGVRLAYLPSTHHCTEFNNMVVAALQPLHVHRVILAAYWGWYLQTPGRGQYAEALDPFGRPDDLGAGTAADNNGKFRAALQATVSALRARGVRVWILRQVPAQGLYVPEALAEAQWRSGSVTAIAVPLAAHRASQYVVDAVLQGMPGVEGLLDPASILCPGGTCSATVGDQSAYRDSSHLSSAGARLLKPVLEPVFE
jgi:peptidoglycan/LPS O-acetylase OafA/YrhL